MTSRERLEEDRNLNTVEKDARCRGVKPAIDQSGGVRVGAVVGDNDEMKAPEIVAAVHF